jgi:hypothetical protein
MYQYLHHLLVFILAASCTAIAFPCRSQNLKESDSEKTNNNVTLTSSQPISAIDAIENSKLGDSNRLSNNPESPNNPSPTTSKKATAKSTPRIPISSRIFATPTMQQ